MACSVFFHPEAADELERLDAPVRRAVIKKVARIAEDPRIGKPLGNRAGTDLSGYFKVYADARRIRIVYRADKAQVTVFIVAVGRREGLEVYTAAGGRVK